MNLKTIIALIITFVAASCKQNNKPFANFNYLFTPAKADSEITNKITNYLDKGNFEYAQKQGFESMRKSLLYFDSADQLAQLSGNNMMKAEVAFAKGKFYETWNKEPLKTIEYYQLASKYVKDVEGKYPTYLYLQQLLANAYAKMPDSTRAVNLITYLYSQTNFSDEAFFNTINFQSELAFIASEVKNYTLAQHILSKIKHGGSVQNDPTQLDYLFHYYIAKARTDILLNKKQSSVYLDSVQLAFTQSTNIFDSTFYSENLSELYGKIGNTAKAYSFAKKHHELYHRINDRDVVSKIQSTLVEAELVAEKRKLEYENKVNQINVFGVWLLTLLIGLVSLLALRINRERNKYKRLHLQLAKANADLDQKVDHINVLNKEVQHRIKNNLFMISSLLQMQQRRTENEETKENLGVAGLRIQSIATLHELLMEARQGVDLKKFVEKLVPSVVKCLEVQKRVETKVNIENFDKPDSFYFPISLLINEWITNSVKYVENCDDVVEINLTIEKQKNGDICVEYFDNCVPDNKPKHQGLGTHIIQLLCKQMNAVLTTKPENHYHYTVLIPNHV